ncbi:unnamed protein product [Bubo scandiacus]
MPSTMTHPISVHGGNFHEFWWELSEYEIQDFDRANMSVSYNDLIDMIKRQEIRKNACLSQATLLDEKKWKSSLRMEFMNWKQAADSVAAVGYDPPNLSIRIESQTSPVH